MGNVMKMRKSNDIAPNPPYEILKEKNKRRIKKSTTSIQQTSLV